MFEHGIWYFLRPGSAPIVTIADDDESVSLADLMGEFVDSAMVPSMIEVKGKKFDMVNLRLKASARNSVPRLYWCAASRVVIEENLSGKVPGLHGKLKDQESGEFVYACRRAGAGGTPLRPVEAALGGRTSGRTGGPAHRRR